MKGRKENNNVLCRQHLTDTIGGSEGGEVWQAGLCTILHYLVPCTAVYDLAPPCSLDHIVPSTAVYDFAPPCTAPCTTLHLALLCTTLHHLVPVVLCTILNYLVSTLQLLCTILNYLVPCTAVYYIAPSCTLYCCVLPCTSALPCTSLLLGVVWVLLGVGGCCWMLNAAMKLIKEITNQVINWDNPPMPTLTNTHKHSTTKFRIIVLSAQHIL